MLLFGSNLNFVLILPFVLKCSYVDSKEARRRSYPHTKKKLSSLRNVNLQRNRNFWKIDFVSTRKTDVKCFLSTHRRLRFVFWKKKSKTKSRLPLPSHHKWHDWTPKSYHKMHCVYVELQKIVFTHLITCKSANVLTPKMNTQSINLFTIWFHNCSPHLDCLQHRCCSINSSQFIDEMNYNWYYSDQI